MSYGSVGVVVGLLCIVVAIAWKIGATRVASKIMKRSGRDFESVSTLREDAKPEEGG